MSGYFIGPLPLDMIASEANSSRSRDQAHLTGTGVHAPGTLLAGNLGGDFTVAAGANSVTAILLYWADLTAGPQDVAILSRDAEVNDAYLVYGNMDPVAVAQALAKVGIIARKGVLLNPATPFAMSRAAWPDPALLGARSEDAP